MAEVICGKNLDGKASIKVFINMINRIRILKLLFKKSSCPISYINLWTISCFNFNDFKCFLYEIYVDLKKNVIKFQYIQCTMV